MKKAYKRLISKFPGWAKWIIGGFFMWALWGSYDSLFEKTNFFHSLLFTIPRIICSIKIPDIFFLILNLAIIYYLAWSSIQNRALQKSTPSSTPLLFVNNAYWASLSVPGLRAKGPYCPRCYSSTPRKDVLMIKTYERVGENKCPLCDFIVQTTEPKIGDVLFGDKH